MVILVETFPSSVNKLTGGAIRQQRGREVKIPKHNTTSSFTASGSYLFVTRILYIYEPDVLQM